MITCKKISILPSSKGIRSMLVSKAKTCTLLPELPASNTIDHRLVEPGSIKIFPGPGSKLSSPAIDASSRERGIKRRTKEMRAIGIDTTNNTPLYRYSFSPRLSCRAPLIFACASKCCCCWCSPDWSSWELDVDRFRTWPNDPSDTSSSSPSRVSSSLLYARAPKL